MQEERRIESNKSKGVKTTTIKYNLKLANIKNRDNQFACFKFFNYLMRAFLAFYFTLMLL